MNTFQIQQFFFYLIRSKNAHALHSPFVYSFYTEILQYKDAFYPFGKLKIIRRELKNKQQEVQEINLGAGSKFKKGKKKKIADIARYGITREKYARLLFRIIDFFQCETILELGTSLGLTTLYLAAANSKSRIYTFEGHPDLAAHAELLFKQHHQNNIEIIRGNFNDTFDKKLTELSSIDFLFIDGNHSYESTIAYFETALKKKHNDSVFVIDDIYWSRDMNLAWEYIRRHDAVTLSIDIFQFGIIFFRKEHKFKEHYTLWF